MPQLATVDELIQTLDLGGDNPARVNQPLLERALESAEKTVAQLTGRQFYPDPALDANGDDTGPAVLKTVRVRRRATSDHQRCIIVRIPDLRSAESVVLDGVALTEGSDFDFDAYGDEPYTNVYLYQAISFSSTYTWSTSADLDITGRWGFLDVPDDIHEAVLQIAARRYHRRNAMFADQVDTGGGAFDFRGGVHPDVQSTLRRYRPVQVGLV